MILSTNGAGVFTPDGLIPLNTFVGSALILVPFIAYFIQLSRLAKLNNKSRIIWAVLPFLFFFMGGLFMYIRMIFLGKKNGWL